MCIRGRDLRLSTSWVELVLMSPVNRVDQFYQKNDEDLQKLVPRIPPGPSSDSGPDIVLSAELNSWYDQLIQNPLRHDIAKRIAEIYYMFGNLDCCLTWLEYCVGLAPENEELQGLIKSVRKERLEDASG